MSVKKIKIEKETRIDQFRPILEKYKDYKSCIRDIKLSCLFGQKVQFDIEDILPHLVIHKYDEKHLIDVGWQKEIRIVRIKFIINSDLIIEDLEVFCDSFLDPNIKVKIRESNNKEIYGFKIELDDNEKE